MVQPQYISDAIYDLTSNADRIFLSYPFTLLSASTPNKVIKLSRLFFFFQDGILVHRNTCTTLQTQTLNGIKTSETFCRLSARTATCLSFKQTFFDHVCILMRKGVLGHRKLQPELTNHNRFIPHTVGYARTNVIGSRTSFFIASVRSSIHCNICI